MPGAQPPPGCVSPGVPAPRTHPPGFSQGEKQLLLAANIGEGILFAGPHHAPIRVVASSEEYKLVTSKPQEILTGTKT